MMKRIIVFFAALAAALPTPGTDASVAMRPVPAERFVMARIQTHDAVFLGTRHRRPKLLQFLGNLLTRASREGLTHVGLEIASDQQTRLDRFMAGTDGPEQIRIDSNIDCDAYRQFLVQIRACGLKAMALDLPRGNWSSAITRDQWMARQIADTFSGNPGARFLVVVGNLHALKRIQWLAPNLPAGGIRHTLSRLRPDLRLFSVAQSIDELPGRCPYADRFGRTPAPVAIITTPLSPPPGFLRLAAAMPMTGYEAVDAVIVY
ncbi:MAG: ChaN family lipoprotein [Desulfobacterales bacterium]|nr:ChaN family lipoprotein [Desulfobacterales bacterium]